VLLTDVWRNASIAVLDGSAILSPPLSNDLKVMPALRPQRAADPAIDVSRRDDVSPIHVVSIVANVGELPYRPLIERFAALSMVRGQ
jgi:hypothetical protein